jgi:hypothetical protein
MADTSLQQIQIVINNYFEAWKQQDPQLLEKVFTNDAKYIVKPFGIEEHHGIDAIKDYWRAKPVNLQVNPSPKIISQAFGKNACFIEWETKFTTSDKKHKIVRGMMRLEFKDGLVQELREHYNAQELS